MRRGSGSGSRQAVDQLKESISSHLTIIDGEASTTSTASTSAPVAASTSDHPSFGTTTTVTTTSSSPAISGTPGSTPRYEILTNFPTAVPTGAPQTAVPTCTSLFTSMKYRNLGKCGIKVPLLGLAVWTGLGTRVTDQVAEEIICMAYDHGINYFDTGDGFGNGRSELLLGNVLRKKNWKRSSFLVSCKLFWTTGPSAWTASPCLSRKFIIEALENSLRRLQLNYVDIVMINKLDGMCPMEEIVRAMQHVLDRGLALYWGTCRWSPVHIMEAFTVARQFNLTPPSLEQTEYQMFCRDKMELYMPELYHKLGVGVISWSPHSLSNDDGIQLISRRAISNEEKSFRSAKQLELNTLAVRLGCDSVQLSIAWSLRNDQNCCVLVSPRSTDQLNLQLNSLKILSKITPSLMEEMETILNNKPSTVVKRRERSMTTISASGTAAAGVTVNFSGVATTTTTTITTTTTTVTATTSTAPASASTTIGAVAASSTGESSSVPPAQAV